MAEPTYTCSKCHWTGSKADLAYCSDETGMVSSLEECYLGCPTCGDGEHLMDVDPSG